MLCANTCHMSIFGVALTTRLPKPQLQGELPRQGSSRSNEFSRGLGKHQPRKDFVLGDLQLEDKLPVCLLTCMEAVPCAVTHIERIIGLHHQPPFPVRVLCIRERQRQTPRNVRAWSGIHWCRRWTNLSWRENYSTGNNKSALRGLPLALCELVDQNPIISVSFGATAPPQR